jgi:hypothetical protein
MASILRCVAAFAGCPAAEAAATATNPPVLASTLLRVIMVSPASVCAGFTVASRKVSPCPNEA